MSSRAAGVIAEDAVAALFSVPVAVGQADPRRPQPPLWPIEAAAMAAARTARRREFAAGRAAARAALGKLGRAPVALPMAQDRAPVWPAGVLGAITHTAERAVAVVARTDSLRGLGLDMEPAAPLEPALWPEIATPAELRWLDRHPAPERGLRARALFAAKEAAFKAHYPVTRALHGFDALELTLRPDGGFTARVVGALQGLAPRLAPGTEIRGRVRLDTHTILAAAELPS